MRNKIKIILLIFLVFSFSIGVSSWILSSVNQNSNDVTHDNSNQFVNVNVHYRTQVADVPEPVTEYFVPKTFTVSHNVTYLDKNGNQSYSALTDSSLTITNDDSRLVYYDVNESGAYTKINERSQSAGPEQIKSFKADVSEWSKVDNATTYADVWNVTVPNPSNSSYRLRFEQDSGNETTGGHGFKYNDGDVYKTEELISEHIEENGNQIITTKIYQRIIVDKQEKIRYGYTKKLGFIKIYYSKWVYYGTFQQRMIRITQTNPEPIDHEDDVKSIQVKKNSLIKAFDLGIDDYKNYGFYSDPNYETYFDFSKPITATTDIYLRYIQSSTGISDTINNTSSGNINLYDQYLGGSGGTVDISTDSTYHRNTNSVFIDGFTLNSGVNLNLTYSSNLTYNAPITGTISTDSVAGHRTTTDNSVAPDYDGTSTATYVGDSNSSCHIKLNGDVTVKGTLTVGGEIGGYSATSSYSFIIGKYAILDLYGNTITIDGGSLISYGIIKDTLGGGKILVKNGGTLTSVLSVTDGRGRDSSALGISKRQSPFTEYKFSYLQVPVKFDNGTSLIGYLKADFADMGVINLNIPVIGATFNSYLFSWGSTNSNEYIMYEPYQIDALAVQGNNVIYKSMYYLRNRFIFNANVREANSLILPATVSSAAGDVDLNIDFARIDIPISPFFDIIVNSGYSVEVNSKMTFYPGSSLYVNHGASLNFKYAGQKTYSEISKTALGMGITIPGETRYIAGGLMSYTNRIADLAANSYSNFAIGVYNQTTYWNYVKESNIVIDGNITFDSGIDTTKSDGFYYLSGNISLSENAMKTLTANRNYVKTYDLKSEIKTAFLFNSNYYSVEDQYSLATSYNINPLISGDKGYFIDKNNFIKGDYDKNTGVLYDDSTLKKYILRTDNDMYEDGSSSSNQKSKIDRNITLQEISTIYSDYKIAVDSSGNGYLRYCGLYVPILSELPETLSFSNNAQIRINARKFMSNSGTNAFRANIKTITVQEDGTKVTSDAVSTQVGGCFSNVIVTYSTSTKNWKHYCYGDYPKTGTTTYYSY